MSVYFKTYFTWRSLLTPLWDWSLCDLKPQVKGQNEGLGGTAAEVTTVFRHPLRESEADKWLQMRDAGLRVSPRPQSGSVA